MSSSSGKRPRAPAGQAERQRRRIGLPDTAAILFPAGFFGSSAGRGATQPNRLIALLYLGVVALTAGVLALGIGLLTA